MKFFGSDDKTALESIELAQFIAYAPIVFQCSVAMKRLGVLEILAKAGNDGCTPEQIEAGTGLSTYGVRVLLEGSLGIGLTTFNDEKYFITKTGYYIHSDPMTQANLDFNMEICYRGMYDLMGSIKEGKPTGLPTLGPWNTIYEGLSIMKPEEQKSWFSFDHFYSSDAFPIVLPKVFEHKPKRLLDIGGNTGKWALKCLNHDPDVHVTLADLPGQLNLARKTLSDAGFLDRVSFCEINLLDENAKLPTGFDAIWMSQFLDCFSEAEIVSILKRCHDALASSGRVYIMEPFWDRQKFQVSAFCLQMTSLYFTNIANGNSQMYHSGLFSKLVEEAGFVVAKCTDNIGVSQSLMECVKA